MKKVSFLLVILLMILFSSFSSQAFTDDEKNNFNSSEITYLVNHSIDYISFFGVSSHLLGNSLHAKTLIDFVNIASNFQFVVEKIYSDFNYGESEDHSSFNENLDQNLGEYISSNNLDISMWTFEDGINVFSWQFDLFKKYFDNIDIDFNTFATENLYWSQLQYAKNSQSLPDIFLIKESWLPFFEDHLMPAPSQLFNSKNCQEAYWPIAYNNFCKNGQVLAGPLFIRSLAMFSNADKLRDDRITVGDKPESIWQNFLQNFHNYNEYIDSKNSNFFIIDLNKDPEQLAKLFALLLTQAGVSSGSLSANQDATDAIDFLNIFASSKISSRESVRDLFASGETSVFFGNEVDYNLIRDFLFDTNRKHKNGELLAEAFQVNTVPQLSSEPITMGEAWGFVVSEDSIDPDTAWGLIYFLLKQENINDYINKTGKTAALKGINPNFFTQNAAIAVSPNKWGHNEFSEFLQELFGKFSKNEIPKEEMIKSIDTFNLKL